MLGGMTLMTTFINRAMTAGFSGLRGEMNARFEAVDARFEAVDAKVDGLRGELNSRFEAVEARLGAKIELLDKDVQALTRRVFGEDRS
jgi:Flp pilus assembly pilin Flp